MSLSLALDIHRHELFVKDYSQYPEVPDFKEQAKVSLPILLNLLYQQSQEYPMADSTSYLTQKIQVLEQQIQNFELERFQHSLVVTDLDPAETDTTIVNALSAQAASAKQAMAVAERRLVVRKAELTKLQAEQKALNTPV